MINGVVVMYSTAKLIRRCFICQERSTHLYGYTLNQIKSTKFCIAYCFLSKKILVTFLKLVINLHRAIISLFELMGNNKGSTYCTVQPGGSRNHSMMENWLKLQILNVINVDCKDRISEAIVWLSLGI